MADTILDPIKVSQPSGVLGVAPKTVTDYVPIPTHMGTPGRVHFLDEEDEGDGEVTHHDCGG
jgi:hypothetical protein